MEYQDHDYVIGFHKGLNVQYVVKSHILLLNPLPSINIAFSFLIQQERQLNPFANQIDFKVFLNKAIILDHFDPRNRQFYNSRQSASARPFQSFTNTRFCTFWGKTRHAMDTCYKKHGYPPGYRTKWYPASANNIISTYESHYLSSLEFANPIKGGQTKV